MDFNDMFSLGKDLLQEEAEFAPNSNATNCVDNGTGDPNVTIPGGLKEQPTAKPEGGEKEIPVPGGLHENPSNSGAQGFVKIGIPGGATLTSDVYNDYLKRLQHTFKEASEAVEMLSHVNVISESVDDMQERFTEEAICNAILESYENGPLFEAVDRSDKKDVKEIVKNLRNKVSSKLKSDGVSFRGPNTWANLFGAAVGTGIAAGGAAVAATSYGIVPVLLGLHISKKGVGAVAKHLSKIFSYRLWQMLGICYIEDGNADDMAKRLNEEFKDELGEYKILPVSIKPNIADVFCMKFHWKNNKNTYMLLIDKKVPSEIESEQNSTSSAIEAAKKESDEKDKKD